MTPPKPERLDLGDKLNAIMGKQGRPAQPAGPRRTKAKPKPPAGVDNASRAAHDYDDEAPAQVPEHLRAYLVNKPAPSGSRLARAHDARDAYQGAYRAAVDEDERAGRHVDEAAARAAGEAARAAQWEFGYLGMDWAGLHRMAAARQLAGLPLDDLDAEAIRRAEILNSTPEAADT